MNRQNFFFLVALLFMCNTLFAQSSEGYPVELKPWNPPMKINIKGGIGSSSLYLGMVGGVNVNLGFAAELPITKSGKWNTNLGLRISNDHFFDYYGVNSSDLGFTTLRLDVPIIFSYDVNIYNNSALRFNFGIYYSKLLLQSEYKISEKEYNDIYIQAPHNAGLELGLAFCLKKFYIALDYNILCDPSLLFIGTTRASIGYRY